MLKRNNPKLRHKNKAFCCRTPYFLLLVYVTAWVSASAQFAQPIGARSAAMGGCTVGVDEAAAVAGAAFAESPWVALSYSQSYLMKGLAYSTLSAVVPVGGSGALVAGYSHYGSTVYNEQQAAMGYALRLTRTIAVGTTLNYLHSGTSDPYYTPQNLVTAAVAVEVRPSESVAFGLHLFNPLAVKYATETEVRVPAIANVGVVYRPVPELTTALQVEKNLYSQPRFMAGLEYGFVEHLFIRTGVATAPIVYSFGFGLAWPHYKADFAVQVHQTLGVTPQLSVYYVF